MSSFGPIEPFSEIGACLASPEEHGFRWYEYIQFIRPRVSSNLFIAYAVVSTHNQFVMGLGREGVQSHMHRS